MSYADVAASGPKQSAEEVSPSKNPQPQTITDTRAGVSHHLSQFIDARTLT